MLKTKIIIFISLISYANGFSQEAENIFHKEYSKLSFVFQPSILKKSDAWNRDGSTYPNMKFTNDFSYQFGVYYNFAQSGNFNFKTGIIAKEFIPYRVKYFFPINFFCCPNIYFDYIIRIKILTI